MGTLGSIPEQDKPGLTDKMIVWKAQMESTVPLTEHMTCNKQLICLPCRQSAPCAPVMVFFRDVELEVRLIKVLRYLPLYHFAPLSALRDKAVARAKTPMVVNIL